LTNNYKKVTFFFNDLAHNKKKTYLTMDIEKFVQQILIHLPPKNFKMINRFSFYGRNITDELKDTIMCPYYKIMMDIQEIYVSSEWYGPYIKYIFKAL